MCNYKGFLLVCFEMHSGSGSSKLLKISGHYNGTKNEVYSLEVTGDI
jgi:hypothetical protein